jgi:hypothetical protein
MVEIMLLAILVAALLGLIALGVEDTKHHEGPGRKYQASPNAIRWEDSLPSRKPLPWTPEETTA